MKLSDIFDWLTGDKDGQRAMRDLTARVRAEKIAVFYKNIINNIRARARDGKGESRIAVSKTVNDETFEGTLAILRAKGYMVRVLDPKDYKLDHEMDKVIEVEWVADQDMVDMVGDLVDKLK